MIKRLFLFCLCFATSHFTLAADIPEITAQQLLEKQSSRVILDVRSPEEYAEGHVPGAINIPHAEIANRLDQLSEFKHQQVVVYCRSGRRAGIAAEILQNQGFDNLLHLEGDILQWQANKLPIEK